jgi:SAM-dependent methyltransferase
VVAQFLGNVRSEVPLAIEQVTMMLQLVRAARGEQVTRLLDLGGSDGVLAAALLDEFPESRAWVLEAPAGDFAGTRQQLDERRGHVVLAPADVANPGWKESIRAGAPFDVIVSAFAIHSLPDPRKRAVYAELFDLLQPGGLFISIEHVASATRWTESVWGDYMIDAIFGEAIKASPGRTRAEVAREYYAQTAQIADRLAPLEVQCDWLREIGFENVECYLKVLELAMFGGQRAGEGR